MKVQLKHKNAYERGVDCVVIDANFLEENWEHDFEITLAYEPWWYSAFWRRIVFTIAAMWIPIYAFQTCVGYYNFPKICTADTDVEVIDERMWACGVCGYKKNTYDLIECKDCNSERPAPTKSMLILSERQFYRIKRNYTSFDKACIWLEHFNHAKDVWYLLFVDHTQPFVILLILAIIIPPIKSAGNGGTRTNWALIGVG